MEEYFRLCQQCFLDPSDEDGFCCDYCREQFEKQLTAKEDEE